MNYTYFSHSNNHYTWIDHILTTDHNVSRTKSCQIIPEESGNVSDHLPIRMEFSVTTTVKDESTNATNQQTKRHGAPYWGNVQRRSEHNYILQRELGNLGTLNIDKDNKDDVESVQKSLDNYIYKVNNIIHSATVESGCLPQTRYKPRPYWCPELSEIRDKKRFWWRLWVDNDRPRTGEVFKCYKYVKKLFRRMCRSRVQGIQLDYYTKTAGFF